jgi:hypothetical protein
MKTKYRGERQEALTARDEDSDRSYPRFPTRLSSRCLSKAGARAGTCPVERAFYRPTARRVASGSQAGNAGPCRLAPGKLKSQFQSTLLLGGEATAGPPLDSCSGLERLR